MAWATRMYLLSLQYPSNKPSYDSDGMVSIGTFLNESIGPTYTYNIRIDEDPSADRKATFLGNLTGHISSVCETLSSDPLLNSTSVNAIGFSQGGLFLRGLVETCDSINVKNLVTFGSPHNGISQFQSCSDSGIGTLLCAAFEGLLESATWTDWVQGNLVPAQYFRDNDDLDSYLESSNWLADINNEREVKSKQYKQNLASVDRFWMYKFSEDTVVVKPESEWFDEVFKKDDNETVVKLRERPIYKEDWIGLKTLDSKGALEFKTAEGQHMNITSELLFDVFQTMYT